ncbi:RsmB/NOP family class I SAM-dependent RNA methyltransferase [Enterovirga sp. CN4-39]|uniref:RsmB/NOP family class I SAM-dependent RNA methyltransferase n=1 Tax=Enterovirga sp. CN4-39 TaxID=3400910 RepID=UPI003C08BE87
MTPAARLSAAVEVLADIAARRRPASDALKDWGLSHRFAGSGDRAAIAGLVYDTLRRRASAGWLMGDDNPRGILLGMLRLERGLSAEEISRLCSGERFAPAPLSDAERGRLDAGSLDDAPPHVSGDFPEWLSPSLERLFGAELAAEAAALAKRAPLDLRVNALKSSRELVQAELAHLSAAPTPYSPLGLRIIHGAGEKAPSIQSDPAFLKGEIEIQDEGSQLAAMIAGAGPSDQVIDLCAGGGGKTLALAAAMGNHGQIYATDSDQRRLAPIHARLERAGVRNVQVRTPRGREDAVQDLEGKADLVLVDAPCTGTGTWRRNPDSKWRVRPGSLQVRLKEQAAVLDRAAELVRPGGRIAYITCSMLPEENDDAVAGLRERRPEFSVVAAGEALAAAGLSGLGEAVRLTGHGLQMSPLRTGTDGFYVAMIKREG